jgi:UDP-N-acetylglucosamine 4-epimerase
VQANLLAAISGSESANKIFNVAFGTQNSLNTLLETIISSLNEKGIDTSRTKISRGEFRQGDIRHSLADISFAKTLLGYSPSHDLFTGIRELIKNTALGEEREKC